MFLCPYVVHLPIRLSVCNRVSHATSHGWSAWRTKSTRILTMTAFLWWLCVQVMPFQLGCVHCAGVILPAGCQLLIFQQDKNSTFDIYPAFLGFLCIESSGGLTRECMEQVSLSQSFASRMLYILCSRYEQSTNFSQNTYSVTSNAGDGPWTMQRVYQRISHPAMTPRWYIYAIYANYAIARQMPMIHKYDRAMKWSLSLVSFCPISDRDS